MYAPAGIKTDVTKITVPANMRSWVLGTPEGDWVSMAVPSDGSYGIPEGVIYGYPVTTRGGEYQVVKGIEISEFSRKRMDATLKELHEERDEIEPAVRYYPDELKIDVSGPYSPDTIFLRGHKGEFDGVIALYHDQATIAVKSISFGAGVNVTLGLPLIRTSVDHGTAYDIAVKWIADESSMRAAINLAAELTQNSRDAA